MSVIQQPEIGISSDHRNSTFSAHHVAAKTSPPPKRIVDLFSQTNASKESEHHDSPATSTLTNTQSSSISSQEPSPSSQELMPDTQPVDNEKQVMKDIGHETDTRQDMDKQNDQHESQKVDPVATKNQPPTKLGHYKSSSTTNPQRGILGAAYKLDTAAGQKRMANGEIKFSKSVSPVNHLGAEFSQLSNSSPQGSPQRSPQIGQLTAKLRTKLTYAMVKVQNGWESKNINEVETLAAQRDSPRISTVENTPAGSPKGKLQGSPRRPSRNALSAMSMSPPGKRSPDSLSSSSGASEIVDSRYAPLPKQLGRPTLAPPVDLGPRNPRRSHTSGFNPPSVNPRTNSNLSDSSMTSITQRVTVTPPTVYRPLGQMPGSQSASAMEQDAIETLLFMSSPGNTQYRPSSQPDSTQSTQSKSLLPPKRSNLSIPPVVSRTPNTDSIPLSPRKKLILDGADLGNDQNIDEILDQMPQELQEEETSSEEDEIS